MGCLDCNPTCCTCAVRLSGVSTIWKPSWSMSSMHVSGLYYTHTRRSHTASRKMPGASTKSAPQPFLVLDPAPGQIWRWRVKKRSKLGFQGLKINRRVNCSRLSKTFPTPIKDDVIYLWGGGKMRLMFGLDGWLRRVRSGGVEWIFKLVML